MTKRVTNQLLSLAGREDLHHPEGRQGALRPQGAVHADEPGGCRGAVRVDARGSGVPDLARDRNAGAPLRLPPARPGYIR